MFSEGLENIDGHVFRDVGGYFEKYFGMLEQNESMFCSTPDWLVTSLTDGVRVSAQEWKSWLSLIVSLHSSRWQHTSSVEPGLLVLRLIRNNDSGQTDGAQIVRAFGIIADQQPDSYRAGFEELCRVAGHVFAEDPLRLFIHGFIVWGTIIELWTIDRSGVYSCKPFDVRDNPSRFVHVVRVYASAELMQLGVNPLRQLIGSGRNILDSETHRQNGVRALQLGKKSLSFNNNGLIIDSFPVVYISTPTASGSQVVVKYKWRMAFEEAEGDLFKSMGVNSPRGVVNLHHAEDIESTSALRAGLQFGPAVKLVSDNDNHVVSRTIGISGSLPNVFVKRHSDRTGDEAYMERILSCTAVYPRGQEMKTYRTPIQAIKAFRDVLTGLRDLYQKCKILHRDVSVYNILLTNSLNEEEGDEVPAGFLIDFEGALDLKKPPQRNQIIGTTVFMAIELLQGKLPHTYRYDLESFFYSLIWFCVQPQITNIRPPEGSRLWRWRDAEDEVLAQNKLQDMSPSNFEMMLAEFHPDFHPFRSLADEIRKRLFPIRGDGSLDIQTDQSEVGTNALYDGIMKEFTAAIEAGGP